MLYRLKMLKQRIAIACLLACVSMAALRAEEPAPVAPADLVQVVDVRVNQLEKGMKDFKDFMDAGAPMFSAMVLGEINGEMLHTNGLDGLDGARPVHLLVYLPKKTFTMTPDEIAAAEIEPIAVQLLPLKDEKVWLDKLGEEVEEVKKDGDYQIFVQRNGMPCVMKVAGKYAVLSITKEAVDVGVAHVDEVAAADAARKTTASAQVEFRPHDLLTATGLDKEDNRAKALATLGLLLNEGGRDIARDMGMRNMAPKFSDADVKEVADLIYAYGSQAETVSLNVTFSKAAANVGWSVTAVSNSELAKTFAAFKSLDVKILRGIQGNSMFITMGGRIESAITTLAKKFSDQAPKEVKPVIQTLVDNIVAMEGQPFSVYTSLDANGQLQVAGESNYKEGTDVAKQIKALQDWAKQISTMAIKDNQDFTSEVAYAEPKDVDGWTVYTGTTTLKAANEMAEQQLMMMQMVFPNPQYSAILMKGTRVIYANGASAEGALAAAKGYAEAKTGLDIKPEFQTWLETDSKDRGAHCEFLLNPYPIIKKVLAVQLPDPEVAKLAQQTVGTLNPLQAGLYVKDATVGAEVRIESESVKQWTAFVTQMMMKMQGGGGEPMPPEPMIEEGAAPGGDF